MYFSYKKDLGNINARIKTRYSTLTFTVRSKLTVMSSGISRIRETLRLTGETSTTDETVEPIVTVGGCPYLRLILCLETTILSDPEFLINNDVVLDRIGQNG